MRGKDSFPRVIQFELNKEDFEVSIDKSLSNKGKLTRHRSVLTRSERVKILTKEGAWEEGRSVFGLPKVKTIKMRKKGKSTKEKSEEASTEAGQKDKT